MPISDAHLHIFSSGFVGPLGSPPQGCDELATYERLRRHHGIERGLVIGYEAEPRYEGNNDHVLALSRTRPWMVPLAYVPISPPPTAAQLLLLRTQGVAGFALYVASEAEGKALSAWPEDTLCELRAQRAVLSLNARLPALAPIAEVIALLDPCPILISHLGLPGRFPHAPELERVRELLTPLLALAQYAHVAVKFSGLYALSDPPHAFPHVAAQPFVDVVLDAFTPARLLWGSDFSPALDFVSFAQAADPFLLTGCSPREVEDVMGGNLLSLLKAHARGE